MTCLPMFLNQAIKVQTEFQKYLYKNKKLIFRKVAVLETAILLEMVFGSYVVFNIFRKLCRSFWFFTKTPISACYSVNLCYHGNVFFTSKLVTPRTFFINLTNIQQLLHKVLVDFPPNLGYLPKRYWSCKMLLQPLKC